PWPHNLMSMGALHNDRWTVEGGTLRDANALSCPMLEAGDAQSAQMGTRRSSKTIIRDCIWCFARLHHRLWRPVVQHTSLPRALVCRRTARVLRRARRQRTGAGLRLFRGRARATISSVRLSGSPHPPINPSWPQIAGDTFGPSSFDFLEPN